MENIIITGEYTKFNPEIVKRGSFIRAKTLGWENPRNGLITFADEKIIRAIFNTGIHVAMSYFLIKADEVAKGYWELTISGDLEEAFHMSSADTRDLISEVRRLFAKEATADDDGNEG